MALWLLRKKNGLPKDDDPWRQPYDKTHEAVVRARNEGKARQIMASKTDGEFRDDFREKIISRSPWEDERYTACEKLKTGGKSGIIVKYFLGG